MKHLGKLISMEGRVFGDLTVLRRAPGTARSSRYSSRPALWLCRCRCGKEIVKRGNNLRSGSVRSCGISHHYKNAVSQVASVERRIWNGMIKRCFNENEGAYKYYGARGISVCAAWRESFEQFLSDVGPRPSPKHSIDRYPNNDGNYEPGNVRWATVTQQNRNQRRTVKVVVDDKLVSLAEYCEKMGVSRRLVAKRIKRRWSLEAAISIPNTGNLRNYPIEWLTGEAFKK